MAATLQRKVKGIWWMVMIWAFMIGYAQIYVGVHFPLDVICGGMLGAAAGILTSKLFNRLYDLNKPKLVKAVTSP
jgi:undecaprenyl-diphosphatase